MERMPCKDPRVLWAGAAAAMARRAGQARAVIWLVGLACFATLACSGPDDGAKGNDSAAEIDTHADASGDSADTAAADLAQLGDAAADSVPDAAPDAVAETACPVAKVKVVEGPEVVPEMTLHLKGTGSHTASGKPVAKYKWTVKQPTGSNQPLLPDAHQAEVELHAQASGEYQFCLEVWDSSGWKSCQPACETVLVIPNDGIHVELTWDTPKDADQSDNGPGAGADLDLHFAHPLASQPDQDCDGKADPWFDNPWTMFWFNPIPAWGDPGSILDDPDMDLDDTDGAGPEIVNMQMPEGTAAAPIAYSIGVYYSDDHGFGPSYATVSVFLQGGLAVQVSKVKLKAQDMWYVGKLNWPNSMSGGSAKVFEACHQSGLSCQAGKNLMWQPKGEWCITPCYTPPPGSGAIPAKLPGAATCTAGP